MAWVGRHSSRSTCTHEATCPACRSKVDFKTSEELFTIFQSSQHFSSISYEAFLIILPCGQDRCSLETRQNTQPSGDYSLSLPSMTAIGLHGPLNLAKWRILPRKDASASIMKGIVVTRCYASTGQGQSRSFASSATCRGKAGRNHGKKQRSYLCTPEDSIRNKESRSRSRTTSARLGVGVITVVLLGAFVEYALRDGKTTPGSHPRVKLQPGQFTGCHDEHKLA